MPPENHSDAMLSRLEKDIEERRSFIEGTTANAQDAERDLTANEMELISDAQKRIESAENQLEILGGAVEAGRRARKRTDEMQKAYAEMRRDVEHDEVEYRTAGHFIQDYYKSWSGDREAAMRLEVATRAAAHQKTSDNLGIIPDPIVGDVVDFIDARRPLVSVIGPQPLPAATWHRPVVTQRPSVAVQGTAGAAADEKAELVSQKMTITRLTATAVTYGGYLNVSRQDIDFSNGQITDIVIQGLARQFAIETEEALGTELDASTAAAVGYGASPTAATIRTALWSAAEDIYGAVPGSERVVLALAPNRLPVFGPLFAPITGITEDGEGLSAGRFNSGLIGSIQGIPTYMSAGLAAGKAFLFSTDAIEVYEQRVGALQVVEPSVAGVQVGYVGYFTPLTIADGGIIELTAS